MIVFMFSTWTGGKQPCSLKFWNLQINKTKKEGGIIYLVTGKSGWASFPKSVIALATQLITQCAGGSKIQDQMIVLLQTAPGLTIGHSTLLQTSQVLKEKTPEIWRSCRGIALGERGKLCFLPKGSIRMNSIITPFLPIIFELVSLNF